MSNNLRLLVKNETPASRAPASKLVATRGLLVTLEAKEGKQDQLAGILNNALALAAREPGTYTWYAYRITETKFGIFDTFYDEAGRTAHLEGEIANILGRVSSDILVGAPQIQNLDLVATKTQTRAI